MHPRRHLPTVFDPPEEQIQHCAYFLWEEMGRPAGRDGEIWAAARERLRHAAAAPQSRPGKWQRMRRPRPGDRR